MFVTLPEGYTNQLRSCLQNNVKFRLIGSNVFPLFTDLKSTSSFNTQSSCGFYANEKHSFSEVVVYFNSSVICPFRQSHINNTPLMKENF